MNASSQKTATMEHFRIQLRRHGLKATSQRLAVHKVMMELGHASADMVCEEIARTGETSITVATVYNILSQLALLGIYDHRLSRNNKMYFDVNTSDHFHLYDAVNHTYRDIADEELAEIIRDHLGHKRFKGYKIEGIDVQIICRPTRKHSVKA